MTAILDFLLMSDAGLMAGTTPIIGIVYFDPNVTARFTPKQIYVEPVTFEEGKGLFARMREMLK